MEHLGDQMKRAVRIAIKAAIFNTKVQSRKFGQYQILVTPRPERKCLWLVAKGEETIAHGVWKEKEART